MGFRSYDVAIVGGGIIGLATAMRLTQGYPRCKVVVLEKEPEFALHQTGHSSGVIHAGLYYPQGSQKADFCWTGGKMLRRYCDEHGVKYEMCGKLIVALDETELPGMEDLYRRGTANGAEGLQVVGPERLRELEPHAAGIKAIHSPNTGIVDYSQVSASFAAEVLENGGDLFTGAGVLGISRRDGRHYLETSKGEVSAIYVVNCAGLQADIVARGMGLDTGLRIIPFRGEYYSLTPERSDLVRALIYPVPDPRMPFLGVHFTRKADGSVEAGPNAVLAFAREGYRKTDFDVGELMGVLKYPGFWRMSRVHWKTGIREQYRSLIKRSFVRSLQALVPEIRGEDLHHPSAGVRAQAVGRDGALLQDFRIVQARNSIHVLNAPSPAATSSLAIGRYIVDLAQDAFGLAA
jgi:L-2-hydroxyglutarate oxidase LhgO